MIVLQHFICYKALPYARCERLRSESHRLFARLYLLYTLHTDDAGNVTSDTRTYHCSRAKLKSWEWPGDEASAATQYVVTYSPPPLIYTYGYSIGTYIAEKK